MTPPGAQRERTALAWRRTALAFTVNSVLLLRSTEVWLQVAALIVLAAAAGMATLSTRTFLDPNTHGWFASGKFRAELLVLLGVAVGILDMLAVTR